MIDDPLYLASGVVFVGIGAALLATNRKRRAALALAVYVVALGLLYASYGVWGRGDFVLTTASWVLGVLTAAGLAAFALLFPTPITKLERKDAAFAAAYGVTFILIVTWLAAVRDAPSGPRPGGFTHLLVDLSFQLIAIVSVATVVLLPLRARHLQPGQALMMRSLGMIAVALLLVSPGGPFPAIVATAHGDVPLAFGAVIFFAAIFQTLLWIPAMQGPHGRIARNIVLALVVLTIGLGVIHQVAGDLVVQIGRLLSAIFLGYAVLAGQIEGLDVKVRFAISKSTIAALFIAVFFIASEVAQQFFGDRYGGPYVGIAAAGLLVFAIAPLSRAADRLAAKAIPEVGAGLASPSRGLQDDGREDTYREAVRLTLRDKRLSRQEEKHLVRLAHLAGIDPGRAMEIHDEVEKER